MNLVCEKENNIYIFVQETYKLSKQKDENFRT